MRQLRKDLEKLTCSKCHVTKEVSLFPKRGRACKECLAQRVRERYQNDEAYREKCRDRLRNVPAELRREYDRRYRNKCGSSRTVTREYRRIARLKNRKKYPLKAKAHTAVSYALRTGKLTKEPCLVCGCKKSEAHHEDYTKPLDVMWLCRKHHRAWHRMFYVDQHTQDNKGDKGEE